jgi:spore germination cell wall hydrolase CwlJ-like protein
MTVHKSHSVSHTKPPAPPKVNNTGTAHTAGSAKPSSSTHNAAGSAKPASTTQRDGAHGAGSGKPKDEVKANFNHADEAGASSEQLNAMRANFQDPSAKTQGGDVQDRADHEESGEIQDSTAHRDGDIQDRTAGKADSAARSINPKDQELLARAIAAEARGEPYDAQVGVAATIMNHAKANKKSINSLVHSSYLSSSSDGNSKFYRMSTGSIPNYQQFQKAAGDALSGKSGLGKDYIYFTDNSIGTPRWVDPSSAVRKGKMVFYKER